MKIVRYGSYDDIDVEFLDNFHYIKTTTYSNFIRGQIKNPYGRDFEEELEIIQKYEPKLFVAVSRIFKDSYEYTRKYKEFCKLKNEEEKRNKS